MVKLPDELKQDTPTMQGIGPGDVLLDQYRVEALLGRGGMGEVYRGVDRHLERPVAIKVLPPWLSESERAMQALRREAARAIELAHPALARIYQFGIHAGLPFVVMEFVDGETLAKALDRCGRMPPAEVADLVAALAEGLDHAHSRGVVHRDVKPSNVLLRGKDRSPVLIDFGIAAEARDQGTRTGNTGLSNTVGTLSYMSPEQLRGAPPAPSMDVYALAVVAYELLAGSPPFFRGDPMVVQRQILEDPPPRPEGVPDAVWAVLARALAKEAAGRPASTLELARGFRAALRGGSGDPEAGEGAASSERLAAVVTVPGGVLLAEEGAAASRTVDRTAVTSGRTVVPSPATATSTSASTTVRAGTTPARLGSEPAERRFLAWLVGLDLAMLLGLHATDSLKAIGTNPYASAIAFPILFVIPSALAVQMAGRGVAPARLAQLVALAGAVPGCLYYAAMRGATWSPEVAMLAPVVAMASGWFHPMLLRRKIAGTG